MMNSEQMLRAAVIMQEASERMERAVNTIDQVWNQMRKQLEPGYGGSVQRLIELLERQGNSDLFRNNIGDH
jgi:hypothetical protein